MKIVKKPHLSIWIITGAGYLFLLIIILTGVFILSQTDKPSHWLTKDPAALVGFNPFTGFVSNLGILLWCSAGAICLFTAIITWPSGYYNADWFLLLSGLLSLVLLFDDFFMFHEYIFPDILHVPEKGIYLGYLISFLVYIFYFRKLILRLEYKILIMAIFLFLLSVLVDNILPQDGLYNIAEDGFKVSGIFTWLVFYADSCRKIISWHNFRVEDHI
jgi:hypothetical protein